MKRILALIVLVSVSVSSFATLLERQYPFFAQPIKASGAAGNPITGAPVAPFLLSVRTNSATLGTSLSPQLTQPVGAYPHAHIAYLSWFDTNVASFTTITNDFGIAGTLLTNNQFDATVPGRAATKLFIWTNSAMTTCVAVFGGVVAEATIGLCQITNVNVTNLFDDFRTNYTVAAVGNNKASNFMSSAVNTLTISFSTVGAVATPTAAVGGAETIVAYTSLIGAHAMEISTNGPYAGYVTNRVTWTDGVNGLPVSLDTLTLHGFSRLGYSTTFPNAETPISESSNWTNGLAVGLDWQNINTSNSTAFGSQPTLDNGFDDSTALLKGAWGSNQTVEATVFTLVNNYGVPGTFTNMEVELRLRSLLSPHLCTGYECLFSVSSNHYNEIVQWNGALGAFTSMTNNTTVGATKNGDKIKTTIINTNIFIFVNNNLTASFSTNTYSVGQPGLGAYHDHTIVSNTWWGLSNYNAWDNN